MRIPIYQVDAFTSKQFAGNPAAVMPMNAFPDAGLMQSFAAENNLAETAFIVRDGKDYKIRWFTPTTEVPLCGHATLASSAVIMEYLEPQRTEVTFHSASGPLTVKRISHGYAMNFPARLSRPIETPPHLTAALGVAPLEVVADEFNYLARLENAQMVRDLHPDIALIARLNRSGVIVTAIGDGDHDFTSRYFAPAKGIPEDPVTGGAHCALAPYWSERLEKMEFRAYQASKRGGEMVCRYIANRVELQGSCAFYMFGEVEV